MNAIRNIATVMAVMLALASFAAPAADHRDPPLVGNYHFLLEIEGVMLGRFASVDGLGAEIEVVEFREGGEGGTVRKIPGRTTYSNIVLKRGYTASDDLWKWMEEIINDDFVTRNGSIAVIRDGKREVARFSIFEAWPSKYRLGVQGKQRKEIAVEELTLTVERIVLD